MLHAAFPKGKCMEARSTFGGSSHQEIISNDQMVLGTADYLLPSSAEFKK
jgi:hypothetical protein